MIYVPFIYFSLFLLIILKIKRRFETSAVITFGFLTTSLFAIIIDKNNLYGSAGVVKSSLNLVPVFLYLSLITSTIVPFMLLPKLTIERLSPIKNIKIFDKIIYAYIFISIFIVLFFSGEIIHRLSSSDIDQLRILYATGEDDLGFSQFSGVTRIIARIAFTIGSEALFLQILYFYSLVKLNKSYKYNLTILICSTMPVIISMLSFDRSKIIYWILSYAALNIFFLPAMSEKSKKTAKINAGAFTTIFALYISIITFARYGNQDIGGISSIIAYAGQSLNNFCLFYEKIDFNFYDFRKTLPLTNYIFNITSENADFYLPIDTAVFASFAGMIMKDIGVNGVILYCLTYLIITSIIFKNIKYFNITNISIIFFLLYIPYLGIFGIYYSNIQKEISAGIFLFITTILRHEIYFTRTK